MYKTETSRRRKYYYTPSESKSQDIKMRFFNLYTANSRYLSFNLYFSRYLAFHFILANKLICTNYIKYGKK